MISVCEDTDRWKENRIDNEEISGIWVIFGLMAAINQMIVDGLIDSRNVDLWNALNKEHEISIVREKRNACGVYTISGKATIYIPLVKVDSASFTHELLHIYMMNKEVFIGGTLKVYVTDDPILSKFMSANLVQHIGNCLEHIKMLPEFLKMGFDRKDFISDYSTNKLCDEELKSIKNDFKTKSLFQREKYDLETIDFYIGKYFAVKACPNLTYDYDKGLSELKDIDTDLYSVLEKFTYDWDKFDYNDKDPIKGGYSIIVFNFLDGLTNWAKRKRVV